jgi:2'-5' RNA ligase
MEKKYSMIITPPESISSQIKDKAQNVRNVVDFDPHINLHSSFLSNGTEFIEKARYWLKEQDPFFFTLRKIDRFPRTSIVYLTSDDETEVEGIRELYFGLQSLLDKEIKVKDNFCKFFPHLTLDSPHPCRNIKKILSRYRRYFENPIPMPIVKVDVAEKIGYLRWEKIDCLTIGNDENNKQLVITGSYQFGDNRRASVV